MKANGGNSLFARVFQGAQASVRSPPLHFRFMWAWKQNATPVHWKQMLHLLGSMCVQTRSITTMDMVNSSYRHSQSQLQTWSIPAMDMVHPSYGHGQSQLWCSLFAFAINHSAWFPASINKFRAVPECVFYCTQGEGDADP